MRDEERTLVSEKTDNWNHCTKAQICNNFQ